MKFVCVFCSASDAIDSHYFEEARKIGNIFAENNIGLVYGGAQCGIMGALADGVLEKSGHVIGVFPEFLKDFEPMHEGITEQILVDDMHTRKKEMFERSDSILVLPGGFGTLDETFEVITWKQIHTHNKQVIIYNYKGYWNKLIELFDSIIDNKFANSKTNTLYDVIDKQEDILKYCK